MKKISVILIALTLFWLNSSADEYVLVSNNKIKTLSKSQIKAIFLKKLILIDDLKVVPVNLGAKSPLRSKFEKKILHMSFSRLKAYWTKQHYLGHRPPISMKSEESVKSFVKNVDGAIGYISAESVDESVVVLHRWSD